MSVQSIPHDRVPMIAIALGQMIMSFNVASLPVAMTIEQVAKAIKNEGP